MIKDVLQSIGGIQIYPVISLLLFMLSFGAVVVWAVLQDKQRLRHMSHLPLEDSTRSESERNRETTGDE